MKKESMLTKKEAQIMASSGITGQLMTTLPTPEAVAKWQYEDKRDGKSIINQIALLATRAEGKPDSAIDSIAPDAMPDYILRGCSYMRMYIYGIRQAGLANEADQLGRIHDRADTLAHKDAPWAAPVDARVADIVANITYEFERGEVYDMVDAIASACPTSITPPTADGNPAKCDLSEVDVVTVLDAVAHVIGMADVDVPALTTAQADELRAVIERLVTTAYAQHPTYDAEYWAEFDETYGTSAEVAA